MTTALAARTGLPGTRTDTSYTPPADLTFEEWVTAMDTLQTIERSVRWWLGDLILFGEEKFNEEASQAFPDAFSGSPYAESTLRASAWVSAAFPRGTRVDGVTWTHHRVVADLPPLEARALLEEAARVNNDPNDDGYISSRHLIERVQKRKRQLEDQPIADESLAWAPQPSDLTDDARAVLDGKLAGIGKRHRVGYERGFLDALLWVEARECYREWKS
jgi:hypothetical protein